MLSFEEMLDPWNGRWLRVIIFGSAVVFRGRDLHTVELGLSRNENIDCNGCCQTLGERLSPARHLGG